MTSLMFTTDENGHQPTNLTRIVVLVHVTTGVAAVRFSPHRSCDVRTTNDEITMGVPFYNSKYVQRNSRTTNDFPYRKGTGRPLSLMMFTSTVSKFFFCSGTYSIG